MVDRLAELQIGVCFNYGEEETGVRERERGKEGRGGRRKRGESAFV